MLDMFTDVKNFELFTESMAVMVAGTISAMRADSMAMIVA